MRSLSAALEEAMKKSRKGPSYKKGDSAPVGQGLVGPGFPGMGSVQPTSMGSQSMSPDKIDNYTDTNMNQPPIDRGMYQGGY